MGGRRGGRRGGRGSGAAGGVFGRMAGKAFRAPKGRGRGRGGDPGGRGRSPSGRGRPGQGGRNRDGQDPRADGRPPRGRCKGGDPIDLITGEVLLTHTDAELPGVLPLVLERTHISSYRDGLLFGRSWASTLDQRLELDARGVHFLAADGTILTYPQALLPNVRFVPVEGPQWPLVLTVDGGYALTDPQRGWTFHFPAPGEEHGWSTLPLTAVTDRAGNRIEFLYEEQTLTEVRHSGGYRIAVDTREIPETGRRVESLRLLTAETDGTGTAGETTLVRFGYDENGLLSEVVNSSGRPLRLTYDDEARLTGWTGRDGFWYRYEYDDEGRAVRGIGKDGFLSVTLAHDPGNRTTVLTDSLGRATTYRYNERLQIVAVTDPSGATVRTEWDRYDRLLSRTDPLGGTTRYGWSEHGDLTEMVRPDGGRILVTYNEHHLPIEVSEPGDRIWRYGYDGAGNIVQVTDPAGTTTRQTYDERGNLTGVTDALGNTTRVESNPAGLPVRVTDPLGNTTRVELGPLGRPVAVTDPLGGVTRYGWTPEGRPAWRTLQDGTTERWTYDAEARPVEHTDPMGQVFRTEYGAFGAVVAETAPDGTRHTYVHDTELRLSTVTNPHGLTWHYTYDAVGNLSSETDFNGRTLSYSYDGARRLISRTNGAGETTLYSRDALGQVLEQRVGDRVTASFTYNPAGELLTAVNPDAEVRFERDPLGRVLAEVCNGRTLSTRYDAVGRPVLRRTPSGAESAWSYDAAGRPEALRTGGQVTTFTRDAAGREVQRQIGAGTVLTQQYDAAHRLLAQTLWGTDATQHAAPLQHRGYGYRADGHLRGISDRLAGDRGLDLDAQGRVTAVHAAGWTERYAYDPAGNLVQAGLPQRSVEDREYSGTLIRRAGHVRYEHDGQGRLVQKQDGGLNWRYHWDAADRLIGVEAPGGDRWRYTYDALGRRIGKYRLSPDGSSSVERVDFTWDGAVLAEELHTRWNGGAWTAAATSWNYEPDTHRPLTQVRRAPLREAPQQWIDQLFQGIVADLTGTPAELVGADGAVEAVPRGTLWGAQAGPVPPGGGCPLRFPGQYHDVETGLNYNYQRYYDPATGRYQTADPLGLTPSPDPHAYVANPLAMIDPLGLEEGHTVLFGQRRVGPNFSSQGLFQGRPIADVADDLRAGRMSPNDVPVNVFRHSSGLLVAENNRSLTALSMAGMQPTNIRVMDRVPQHVLDRLNETPVSGPPRLPSTRVAITPSQSDDTVLREVRIAPPPSAGCEGGS
ncbi:RHS repeat protein [Actinomadura sp. KC06]|uniref:DUF6531 domain-containing protein n=1 Tax=Actinomadura sp. KC06 TaxID=2530369 RepID=UPI001047DA95|nr:DUF6531 domain-containing protein [Actinomadura sp. KC06]TDD35529.1 RHS repeat protein [Actinomadura sp. KC06]